MGEGTADGVVGKALFDSETWMRRRRQPCQDLGVLSKGNSVCCGSETSMSLQTRKRKEGCATGIQ